MDNALLGSSIEQVDHLWKVAFSFIKVPIAKQTIELIKVRLYRRLHPLIYDSFAL